MRWMVRVFFAFSFSLAFAAFGCERSSDADNGSKNEGSTPAPVESNEPIKSLGKPSLVEGLYRLPFGLSGV